jgi:hypothetical protein
MDRQYLGDPWDRGQCYTSTPTMFGLPGPIHPHSFKQSGSRSVSSPTINREDSGIPYSLCRTCFTYCTLLPIRAYSSKRRLYQYVCPNPKVLTAPHREIDVHTSIVADEPSGKIIFSCNPYPQTKSNRLKQSTQDETQGRTGLLSKKRTTHFQVLAHYLGATTQNPPQQHSTSIR